MENIHLKNYYELKYVDVTRYILYIGCTLYNVHCTLYNVQCTIFIAVYY